MLYADYTPAIQDIARNQPLVYTAIGDQGNASKYLQNATDMSYEYRAQENSRLGM